MHKVPNNIVLQNRKCLVAKYTSRICMLNLMLVIGLKNQKVTKLMKLASLVFLKAIYKKDSHFTYTYLFTPNL